MRKILLGGGVVVLGFFNLSAQIVESGAQFVVVRLPVGERNACGFFGGGRFVDAVEHACDVSSSASEAGVVTLFLQEADGEHHDLGVIGAQGDELFGIFEGARVVLHLLTGFDKGAKDGGFSGSVRKALKIMLEIANQCATVVTGIRDGFLQFGFGVRVFFRDGVRRRFERRCVRWSVLRVSGLRRSEEHGKNENQCAAIAN